MPAGSSMGEPLVLELPRGEKLELCSLTSGLSAHFFSAGGALVGSDAPAQSCRVVITEYGASLWMQQKTRIPLPKEDAHRVAQTFGLRLIESF
jgi:hypothetical protein